MAADESLRTHPWSGLPRYWLHIPLPRCREVKEVCTYHGFSFDDLPPISVELDDRCNWLLEHGAPQEYGLHLYAEHVLPPRVVRVLAQDRKLILPTSFERFMTSPVLQERVRSCTDCYLDPGERIVETTGTIAGHLIHFLSDSQSCAHWYLHVLPNGESAVLVSGDLYGYRPENSDWIENPACRAERVDLSTQDFAFCARSFSEFLYRFWIENEIWWWMTHESASRALSAVERAYVEHYQKRH